MAAPAKVDAKAPAPAPTGAQALSANLDKYTSAVVLMDFQNGILNRVVGGTKLGGLLGKANEVLTAARENKVPVVYVRVACTAGYTSISKDNKVFAGMIGSGMMLDGTEDVAIHNSVAPAAGEAVVTKRRFGALYGTDLAVILSGLGAKHLILLGVSTSGAVLSTLRTAADMDFACSVISDGCYDHDDAVHEILMTKVFARQAAVATVKDFVDHFAAKKSAAAAPAASAAATAAAAAK